jgi:hypothetical protein
MSRMIASILEANSSALVAITLLPIAEPLRGLGDARTSFSSAVRTAAAHEGIIRQRVSQRLQRGGSQEVRAWRAQDRCDSSRHRRHNCRRVRSYIRLAGGMASLYTRAADRARLVKAAMAKLDRTPDQHSISAPSRKVREPERKDKLFQSFRRFAMVRSRGLEPPRVAPLAPQASASTTSATTAGGLWSRPKARHRATADHVTN